MYESMHDVSSGYYIIKSNKAGISEASAYDINYFV